MTLLDQLRRDEGDVLHLYYLAGIPHIGVGHNLRDDPLPATLCARIVTDEATSRQILELDLRVADEALDALPWARSVSEPRRGVLLNVAFNVGLHGLFLFHDMLAAMKSADWKTAAAELLDSRAAAQSPERYKRLAEQLVSDQWV